MASNTQSTQPERYLGPPLSLVNGASNFTIGEYILTRIPEPIQVLDGHVDDEATAAGMDLPLTSNGQSSQHFAFIHQVTVRPDGSYLLEVYPVVSFNRSGGPAFACYDKMSDTAKATLLPLPPLALGHPQATPEAFGAPLELGGWSDRRGSFVLIDPMEVVVPLSRPFKRMNPPLVMSPGMLNRIHLYREHLRLNMRGSNASLPGIINDAGGGNLRGAGAGLEEFSANTYHDILVIEGMDEDAEGREATMLDDLRLLAYGGDPIWVEELRKYMQKEEEEREQIQKERAVRLAHWREGLTMPPV